MSCEGPLGFLSSGFRGRNRDLELSLNLRVPASADMDLGVPMEFPEWSLASFVWRHASPLSS